ncbi:MAG: hypothetical protein AAGA85_20805 [Bacteroidota bacterium]
MNFRIYHHAVFVCLTVMLTFCAWGQSAQWSFRTHQEMGEAHDLMEQKKYDLAAKRYQDVLQHEDHPKAQFLAFMGLAEVSVLRGQMQAAADYYQNALEIHQPEDDEKLLQIAEVFMASGKLDEAFDSYQQYASTHPEDGRSSARMAGIEAREQFYQGKANHTVELLEVNSPEADFAPFLYEDGLAFLSGRGTTMLKKKDRRTNSAYLQFYYAASSGDDQLATPEKLMKKAKLKYNDGPMSEGVKPGSWIITRNVCKPNADKNEEVFVLQLLEIEEKANGKWSKPKPLSINDPNYSFGHPSMSKDRTALYFVSDMPGGYGGTDIYQSVWDGSSWSQPVNLGPTINSAGNEMFPHIHEDSVLYFSSNGHPGLGGMDLYSVNLYGQEVVSNLGDPINTPLDDFSLVRDGGSMGYFASNREGGTGQDDIYRVTFHETAAEGPTEPLMADLAVDLPDTLVMTKKDIALLPPEEVTKDLLDDEIVGYTVQILAMKKPEDIQSQYFKGIHDIVFYEGKDGFRRYTHGIYPTFAQALVAMKRIREMGLDDAFVRGLKRYEELSIQKYPVAFEVLEE